MMGNQSITDAINDSVSKSNNTTSKVVGYLISAITLTFGCWVAFWNQESGWLNILGVYAFFAFGMTVLSSIMTVLCLCLIDRREALDKIKPSTLYTVSLNTVWVIIWGKMLMLDYIWAGSVGMMSCFWLIWCAFLYKGLLKQAYERADEAEEREKKLLKEAKKQLDALDGE